MKKEIEPQADQQLALIEPATALSIVADGEKFNQFYEKIKAETDAFVPNLATVTSRKEIASLAYKVARTKTALDDAGKSLTEEARLTITAVDKSRREIRSRLDALRDEVRKPLTDWENKEEERKSTIRATVVRLQNLFTVEAGATMSQIAAMIEELAAIDLPEDIFGDDLEFAQSTKDGAATNLEQALGRAKQAEDDAIELQRLREAEAERIAAEAEAERIAAEAEAERIAAEAERIAAEAAAKREAERKEQEARREADEEKRQAQLREEAAEKAAQDARDKAEAERLELEREHEAKLEELRKDAAAKEQARLDEQEAARFKEEERIAAERIREEERLEAEREASRLEKARIEDREHRSEIMKEAKEALMEFAEIDEATAKKVVIAITGKNIPHIGINF